MAAPEPREGTVTVKDLVEELQNFDHEDEVVFTYNYGDYSRTEVIEFVDTVDEEYISADPDFYGEYHTLLEEEPDEEEEETRPVVLLRGRPSKRER